MTSVLINRERDTRDACPQRKNHVRLQQEDSCLQTKEKGVSTNQINQNLDLRLLTSTEMRK